MSVLHEKIMEYLTPHRMMSLENLSTNFDMTPKEISPLLDELEGQGRVRRTLGKCSSGCSSCSSCDSDAPDFTNPGTIVISCVLTDDEE